MYCNATTTRLLVGRLTPAIRATFSAPVAGVAGRFLRSRYGENAKCRDDTRPSARAGIVVVLMQNGCRVLKDSKSFRQPLLMTELTRFISVACPRVGRFSWPACRHPFWSFSRI